MKQKPFSRSDVEAVFALYPSILRGPLLNLRHLIFETAKCTDGVGALDEMLKWGQPSYLTSGCGTTLRLGPVKYSATQYALYFHCQTSLAATFGDLYGETLNIEGNRSIVFDLGAGFSTKAVTNCIALALTYHLKKRLRAR